MSAFTKPIVLGSDGTSCVLERVPLTAGTEGQQSERWLQQALFAAPQALPVAEIDPHIGPLIPVCMELETGAGPADILFVTPTGQIVLVETKLWRNPEARREVVGQILDYAKQLTTWTYQVLEEKAALAAGTSRDHLLSCLRRACPSADETAFVDGIGRSLSVGDFLLLIVGDGIRYGAEALVAFLERYGHVRFGLGLVEVAMYRLAAGGTLLQPRVLAKTEILQRTLVMGPAGPLAFQQAAQAEDASAQGTGQQEWFRSFWSEFLTKLALDDRSLVPAEPAKSTNQFFPMPPSGSACWISAYIAQSTGRAGVYLTFAKAFGDRATEVFELLRSDREAVEKEVGVPLAWEQAGDRKYYIAAPNVQFSDLDDPAQRQRVTSYLADMTGRMIKVFRPRMEAATRSSSGTSGPG
jgi:hypothetical protein